MGPNGGTYNIPFEMIIPQINTMEPTGTTISPSVRTVSGTSVSGVEPSFVDKGFEEVSLRQENFFTDPRIVSSNRMRIFTWTNFLVISHSQ